MQLQNISKEVNEMDSKLMFQFLEERIAKCRERAETLEKDFRKDEAVFEKVRENVYSIFRTVLKVAREQHDGDEAAIRLFFEIRLQQIPASWEVSLEKARQHGDESKALIEEIKLAVISDIRLALEEK